MNFSRQDLNVIADFRGLPRDTRVSRERHGRVSIGSAIAVFEKTFSVGQPTPHEVVLDEWPRIVGPRFARHSTPQSISRNQALVVRCPDAILRREMMFAEDEIMTRMRSIPELADIARLIIRAG